MLLSTMWELYASDKRFMGYSEHTLKAYRLQHRILAERLGDPKIEDVTFGQLKEYLGTLTHLKPASVGHRIRFIRSFFRWAQDESYNVGNPASKLMEPKTGQRIPKALSEEDFETLRIGCQSALEHSIIEFIYSTGCRIGEVVGLNRNSITWEDRSCIVRGKGDKEREVYFTIRAEIWLKKYLRERQDTDIALFVTERKPHRISIAQMRYIVKRVANKAGVNVNVYPHKLRHSYATHLLNNGAPLELIQSLLGHAKMDTTRVYAILSGKRRQELYRKYFN